MLKGEYQIGILGGSFDPVHMGHLGLAQEVYKKFDLDQVLFIPAFQAPHKKTAPLASSVHRLEMLKLTLKDSPHFSVSDKEIHRKEVSYTIDTLNDLQIEFPSSKLFLIIGYDNLFKLDSWKDAFKIMKKHTIVVASRPGMNSNFAEKKVLGMFKGDSPYILRKTTGKDQEFYHQETGSRLIVFNIRPRDISSSLVREQLAQGKSMENLLPREVERYIIEQKIYHSSIKSKPI
jgi:nicotinate-nucleotide adenylyltransferase